MDEIALILILLFVFVAIGGIIEYGWLAVATIVIILAPIVIAIRGSK